MISCKCITYGRVSTLEELIYSFINQEYDGWSELIIVNDYPLQKLVFDHPKVKIFNLDETFATIGEKENYAIERCSGNVIAVFDDDDIAMPNHLCNIAAHFVEGSNLMHWGEGVYYNDKKITAITSIGNSGIVYSKRAWEAIGKSPLMNAGGDMVLVYALIALDSSKVVYAYPEEPSWFYYWAHRSFHQSGLGTDVEGRPNIVVRNSAYIEQERLKGNIPTGEIVLVPSWSIDYKQQLKDFMKNGK